MRVEGDGDGPGAERAGAGDDLGDDPLMAAMDAIEVADGGDGWTEVGGNLCELAEDLHQAISNFICCRRRPGACGWGGWHWFASWSRSWLM